MSTTYNDAIPQCKTATTFSSSATSMDNVEDIYSLSPVQKGILLHSIASPDTSDLYHVQLTAEVESVRDLDTFERAWRIVFRRHPVLRTAFLWEDFEDPVQVVFREIDLPVIRLERRDLGDEEWAQELERLLEEDRAQSFSPSEAPLARLRLIRLRGERVAFMLSFHALLVDGWSKGVILKELLDAHSALSSGVEPELPPAQPLKKYVRWLKESDFSESRVFWQRMLKGIREPTPMLPGRRSSTEDAHGFGECCRELDETLNAKLEHFGRTHRLTTGTMFQAVWALLLSRYSGREEVLFGAAVSGRSPEVDGSESIVGFLINTAPVRIRIRETAGIVEWAKEVQEQQNELRAHENTPLAAIRQWSEAPEGRALFDSVVLLQNWSGVDVLSRFRRLRIHPLPRSMYPLTLCLLPQDAGNLVYLAYHRSRLDHAAVSEMLDDFLRLLEGFVERPEGPLSDLLELVPEKTAGSEGPGTDPGAGTRRVPPRTGTERAIAEISGELLGVEEIGVHDNFFELGGQSLFAVQLISGIRAAFDIEMLLGTVFENPTVAALAERVEGYRLLTEHPQPAAQKEWGEDREEMQI